MLVADGVLPSNEGRGYVLRRIIRRAVLAARRAGAEGAMAASLVDATIEKMGAVYPTLVHDRDLIVEVLEREEAGFARTLRTGLTLLEEASREVLARGSSIFPCLLYTSGRPFGQIERLCLAKTSSGPKTTLFFA